MPFVDSVDLPSNGVVTVATALNVEAMTPLATLPFGIAATAGSLSAEFSGQVSVVDNLARVHFIYLVPSDKVERGTKAIERVARNLQIWYRNQMGNGKTFTLALPVVKVLNTPQVASWFLNNPAGDNPNYYYWNNTLNVVNSFTGSGFYQKSDIWIIYNDSAVTNNSGAGGTSGMAVLHEKDVSSVMGESDWTMCRGIGGAGHEVGHAFYLPHPPDGSNDWQTAIMGFAYGTYPNASLTEADKTSLNSSNEDALRVGVYLKDFFTPVGGTSRPLDCSSLSAY
ncbi:MAG TPA: hypothetical protein VNJ01_10015 [Bacteriovoracaceae bacterium]|nr:hypothetical protein [Bacteriovoracaceae bacterium]